MTLAAFSANTQAQNSQSTDKKVSSIMHPRILRNPSNCALRGKIIMWKFLQKLRGPVAKRPFPRKPEEYEIYRLCP